MPQAARSTIGFQIAEDERGQGTIETYTVIFDRSGPPELGIILGRLDDGGRFVANTPSVRTFLENFISVEEVGRTGRVEPIDRRNIFEPD